MPVAQVANVPHFPFGSPAAIATVLSFRVKKGCKLNMQFTSHDNALTVSVEVSPDGTNWSATTAAANVTAVTSAAIAALGSKNYEVLMRAGVDLWMRVRSVGAGAGAVQIRGGENLEIVTV